MIQFADTEFHLGFTGTRKKPTADQYIRMFEAIERQWLNGDFYFHHGDCVGADTFAHWIALGLGMRIIIHPPTDPKFRAFNKDAHFTHEPLPYLQRNRVIVDQSCRLVAVPETREEVLRSGTWSTWRYAKELKRPIDLILP